MDDVEKIKQIYLYLVQAIYFDDPVGLDMWWYLSDQSKLPTYVENRSISPMLYRVGSCEDFASTMVVLLEQLGFESEYVAGYTIGVGGGYVDHAWLVVNLYGNWFHLDPQLEQNVIRENSTITYRFFLKTDNYMLRDHKWGKHIMEY